MVRSLRGVAELLVGRAAQRHLADDRFGKWHLGDNYPYRPHDRGFDEAIVHRGRRIGSTHDFWRNDYFEDPYYQNGEATHYAGYGTELRLTSSSCEHKIT